MHEDDQHLSSYEYIKAAAWIKTCALWWTNNLATSTRPTPSLRCIWTRKGHQQALISFWRATLMNLNKKFTRPEKICVRANNGQIWYEIYLYCTLIITACQGGHHRNLNSQRTSKTLDKRHGSNIIRTMFIFASHIDVRSCYTIHLRENRWAKCLPTGNRRTRTRLRHSYDTIYLGDTRRPYWSLEGTRHTRRRLQRYTRCCSLNIYDPGLLKPRCGPEFPCKQDNTLPLSLYCLFRHRSRLLHVKYQLIHRRRDYFRSLGPIPWSKESRSKMLAKSSFQALLYMHTKSEYKLPMVDITGAP